MTIVEALAVKRCAFAFSSRTAGDFAAPALSALMESDGDELFNAMAASYDDRFLVASRLPLRHRSREVILFAVLEEEYVRRSNAAFVGNRPVSYFGQIAFYKAGSGTPILGIRAAAISLCATPTEPFEG